MQSLFLSFSNTIVFIFLEDHYLFVIREFLSLSFPLLGDNDLYLVRIVETKIFSYNT